MTTRRAFIKGAVAAAVSASLPVGDGVSLYSAAHPVYTHKTYKIATEHMPRDLGCQMARALARSMMQTKEIVASNVLSRAFLGEEDGRVDVRSDEGSEGVPRLGGGHEYRTLSNVLGDPGEGIPERRYQADGSGSSGARDS